LRGWGYAQPKEVLEQDGQPVTLEGCHRVSFSRARTAITTVDLIVRGREGSRVWPVDYDE
jgi:hypothetical protein